jgi:tRNA uridine 5-carboxymethylaminomethyl modification enzyme
LRADNADQRLTAFGYEIGCVNDTRWAAFSKKLDALDSGRMALEKAIVSSRDLNKAGVRVSADGPKRSLYEALTIAGTELKSLIHLSPDVGSIDQEIATQLERDALYSHYVQRQKNDVDALRRDSEKKIPNTLSYDAIDGLSNELKTKLNAALPDNIAQAARVDGITPAALMLIIAEIKKTQKAVVAS